MKKENIIDFSKILKQMNNEKLMSELLELDSNTFRQRMICESMGMLTLFSKCFLEILILMLEKQQIEADEMLNIYEKIMFKIENYLDNFGSNFVDNLKEEK